MKGFKYNGEGRELEALFQVCKRKKNFLRSPPRASILVPFSVVPVPLWYCINFPASIPVPISVVPPLFISLDTFTLTLETSLLKVIKNPKV